MKRLFILTILAGLLINTPTLTASENEDEVTLSKIEGEKFDNDRARILQAFLAKYHSPLQYQAQDLVASADKYSLDWRMVAAIAGVESTFGKFIPGGYNAWGWGVYGDQAIYFKSWKEGIYTVSEGLKKNYIDRGLTNPYTINKAYAESPFWGGKVMYFLNKIKEFEQEYNKEAHGEISQVDTPKIAGESAQLVLN